ncbi:hypothetical protein BaRGS_00025658, partial [Batillaria attramentaria]
FKWAAPSNGGGTLTAPPVLTRLKPCVGVPNSLVSSNRGHPAALWQTMNGNRSPTSEGAPSCLFQTRHGVMSGGEIVTFPPDGLDSVALGGTG